MYLLGTLVTWMLTVWAVFEMNMVLTMLFGALSLLFAWLGRAATAGGDVHHHQHVHHHTYGPTYIDARSLTMADGRPSPFATPERMRQLTETRQEGARSDSYPLIEAPRERPVELTPIDVDWSELRRAKQIEMGPHLDRFPQHLSATVTPRLEPPKKRQSLFVALIMGPKK
jgi:hypothetical protein